MTIPSVSERCNYAKHWIDSLYQTDGRYGYIKEFPAFPLGIYVRENSGYRFSGDWIRKDVNSIPVSRLTKLGLYRLSDVTGVGLEDGTDGDYNEPVLTVWRTYADPGVTTYTIRFEKFQGNNHVDVYVGDMLLWPDVGHYPPTGPTTLPPTSYIGPRSGYTESAISGGRRYSIYRGRWGGSGGTWPKEWSFKQHDFQGRPCNRYTVRHAARLGQFLYQIWGDMTKATTLSNIRSDYGFTYDIYDPVFGISTGEADGFMFTDQAYADTFNVWTRLPRGKDPHRFPYLSKVNRSDLTRTAYIMQSHGDSLLRMLQAIHVLNKYANSDHQYYTNAGPPNPFDYIVTPTSIAWECVPSPFNQDPQAKNMWSYYQGGILHPSDASVVSGVRTAVWSILTTLLCYKYGVGDLQWIADHMYNSLIGNYFFGDGRNSPQAGVFPYSPGWIETADDGQLLRPPYFGAFYNIWKRGVVTYNGPPCYGEGGTENVQPCTHINVVAVDKTSSWMSDLADRWNMPSEDSGPIVSNPETTILMIQALRIYAYYALNTLIPAGQPALIP